MERLSPQAARRAGPEKMETGMAQPTEELPDGVVGSARQFITLRQGKNAGKGWAASALLGWIVDAEIDEKETALDSITSAAFAQPSQDPDGEDHSDTNWILVMREMEVRGLGKLVLGRHGWPTRFSWRNGSSLGTACAVLERPLPATARQQRPEGDTTRARSGQIPPTKLSVGRIEVRLPLGGATEDEWAELARWVARRGA